MKRATLRKHLKPIGQTVDGATVLGGAFFVHDTMGLPLGEQIRVGEWIKAVPSIPDFVEKALAAGWRPQKIEAVIREELTIIGRGGDVDTVLRKAGLV